MWRLSTFTKAALKELPLTFRHPSLGLYLSRYFGHCIVERQERQCSAVRFFSSTITRARTSSSAKAIVYGLSRNKGRVFLEAVSRPGCSVPEALWVSQLNEPRHVLGLALVYSNQLPEKVCSELLLFAAFNVVNAIECLELLETCKEFPYIYQLLLSNVDFARILQGVIIGEDTDERQVACALEYFYDLKKRHLPDGRPNKQSAAGHILNLFTLHKVRHLERPIKCWKDVHSWRALCGLLMVMEFNVQATYSSGLLEGVYTCLAWMLPVGEFQRHAFDDDGAYLKELAKAVRTHGYYHHGFLHSFLECVRVHLLRECDKLRASNASSLYAEILYLCAWMGHPCVDVATLMLNGQTWATTEFDNLSLVSKLLWSCLAMDIEPPPSLVTAFATLFTSGWFRDKSLWANAELVAQCLPFANLAMPPDVVGTLQNKVRRVSSEDESWPASLKGTGIVYDGALVYAHISQSGGVMEWPAGCRAAEMTPAMAKSFAGHPVALLIERQQYFCHDGTPSRVLLRRKAILSEAGWRVACVRLDSSRQVRLAVTHRACLDSIRKALL